MKIAVMTDSTSYLSQDLIDKYNIQIAPLSVTFDDGKNFTESNEIAIEEFYNKMASSQTIPTTSQPAIGEWITKYEMLRDQGYTDIIVICLSSGISGSYQSSYQAGEMVEGVNVHAFDSKLAAMIEGCYVLRAIEMVEEGYEPQQIIDDLTNMREHTGAGKTEMMFQGIQYARRQGDNIAIVSPRVDVVVEISKRIKDAFLNEDIDILHQQSSQQFEGHFVVCTVHQLYRFKQHFDTIFIDEVDAFPLSMDKSLQQALKSSSKVEHATIYMTATPPKQLLSEIPHENIIKLPARFHKKSLPVPKYRYFKLNNNKIQKMLYRILQDQINNQRYTLVFFNNIETMIKTFSVYKQKITKLTYVHSEDVFRFEKVEQLRNGHFDVIFTTTILERGFTMANLDVVVIDAHQYTQEALIQIAGRVGRKLECPAGKVLFFHEGVSMNMIQAKKEIQRMNKLALKRGWIDE